MSDLEPLAWGGGNLEFAPGPDGEPWIFLAALCRMLDINNHRQVASRLDEDEKGVITSDTLGGPQETIIVSETAAYQIIMQSRKPQAKQFMRLVADHIKSLRKHGHAMANVSSDNMALLVSDPIGEMMLNAAAARAEHLGLVARTNEIERKLASLGDLDDAYTTIIGWFNRNGGTVDDVDAQIMGKHASKVCRNRNIKIGVVKHERWGSVQTYPESIVTETYEWFAGRRRS